MDLKIRMPLVCQAGPAAEASVGSLPSVKNISTVKYQRYRVNKRDAPVMPFDSIWFTYESPRGPVFLDKHLKINDMFSFQNVGYKHLGLTKVTM